MTATVRFSPLLLAALLVAGCGDSAPSDKAPSAKVAAETAPASDATTVNSVKPWVKERYCAWWISADDGKHDRATIEQGDELMLHLSDPIFLTWSEEERPRVELMFDRDPKRRIHVEGWASHGDAMSSSFGLYLDAQARRALAGATRLELRRDGRLIIDLPLAATPSQAELDACVPPPDTHPDEEEE